MQVFGIEVDVTQDEQCKMSTTNHKELVRQARVDRAKAGFDVDNSYVLCMYCVKLLSLKI